MSLVLVTGTDTGVGKTFVACALIHALRAQGRRVGVMKPVETGVEAEPEDALRLREAAGDPAALDDVCPYRFRAPLAPAAAAPLEGVTIDPLRITTLVTRRAAAVDVLVVEGAGGLLVPLTTAYSYLDLARDLAMPLLIVAANRLGTLNHCALTAHAARTARVCALGVTLSDTTAASDPSAASNPSLLPVLTGLPLIAIVPHCAEPRLAAPRLAPLIELL